MIQTSLVLVPRPTFCSTRWITPSSFSSRQVATFSSACWPFSFSCGWDGRRFKRQLNWRIVRIALVIGAGAATLGQELVLASAEPGHDHVQGHRLQPAQRHCELVVSICGILIYLRARARVGRIVALLALTFAGWAPMVFTVLVVVVQRAGLRARYGTGLYNGEARPTAGAGRLCSPSCCLAWC